MIREVGTITRDNGVTITAVQVTGATRDDTHVALEVHCQRCSDRLGVESATGDPGMLAQVDHEHEAIEIADAHTCELGA